MGLTKQQNFRLGFLLRCAEEGLAPAEIRERVKLAKASGWSSLGDAIKAYGLFPFQLAAGGIATAGLGGAGIGYGLAKMQDEQVDPEEAKQQELIAAYKMQAERARRRAQQRTYRRPAPAAPRLMM